MLGVIFLAVSKVIVAVLVGAFTCNSIPNSATTMRDFSFLISNVLLPSLTVTNIAKSVSAEVLVRCSILIFFSILIILQGIISAVVMAGLLFGVKDTAHGIPLEMLKDARLDLLYDIKTVDDEVVEGEEAAANGQARPRAKRSKKTTAGTPYVALVLSDRLKALGVSGNEVVASLEVPSVAVEEYSGYYWGLWVACSIQNSVTLPLSLFQNLAESFEWINLAEGTAYIFVFSIVVMVYIWVLGPLYVEWAQKESTKRRLIREIVSKHKKMIGKVDAVTQTDISCTFADGRLVVSSSGEDRERTGCHRVHKQQHDEGESSTHVSLRHEDHGDGAAGEEHEQEDHNDASLMNNKSFAAVQTSGPCSPNTLRRSFFPQLGGAEHMPYDWQKAGFIRVHYECDLKAVEGPSRYDRVLRGSKQLGMRLLQSMPFMAIVVGMLIGIVPPLRALFFDGGYLEMVMDAVSLIAQGNIPAALLLLGANLVGSARPQQVAADGSSGGDVRLRHSEQNTEFPLVAWTSNNDSNTNNAALLGEDGRYAEWYNETHEDMEFDVNASFSLQAWRQQTAAARVVAHNNNTSGSEHTGVQSAVSVAIPTEEEGAAAEETMMDGVRRALSLAGVSKLFVWGVIAVRLIVTPLISFISLVLLHRAMPFLFGGRGTEDKTLLLVLFIELAAPTAINSALLYNQRNYMTYEWAKMLFFQYVLCTVSMVMWSTFGLWYVDDI